MSDYQDDSTQDDGPPELTHEDIKNSVFEFDPVFEFDAPQWFDFTDIKSLYYYGFDSKTPLQDGEWVDGLDWFDELHEGHEPEYYGYSAYEDDFIDESEFDMVLDSPQKSAISSPSRSYQASSTPKTPPQLAQTPSQSRCRSITSALSPGSTKTDSPMRSGAVRLRPDAIMATSMHITPSSSSETVNQSVPKKSGAQRLIVQASPPQTSPSHKSTSSPTDTKLGSAASKKMAPSRQSPSAQTPPKPSEKNTVLPRYMDNSKPAHQTQLPPRSMVSRNQGITASRVTQRRVAPNVTKRHIANSKPEICVPAVCSPPTMTKQTLPPTSAENSPSIDNSLLKQVDQILLQQKAKQRPVYEPRRFGIKEIKAWEQMTGRRWHELTFEERQVANEQMDDIRKTGSIQS